MNYTILKIKMGNMVSENQVINQYKKIGYQHHNLISDIVKEINDFLFKKNNKYDFWKNEKYDGEIYYVVFKGNKEKLSYCITPHIYQNWQ